MIKTTFIISLVCLFGLIRLSAQTENKIFVDNDIQLIHIQDSIYLHETWSQLENFGRFSSNGLIVIKNGQALMIDTPMDNDKTKRLTKIIKDSLNATVTKLIICHFHDDCLGGLEYLKTKGVESIANNLTVNKCKELKIEVPSSPFSGSLTFDFNGITIDCRYFGAGHTFDNITVYIPSKNILFGGCLIKSINSENLGNTSDAVISEWDSTVKKLMQKYGNIKVVIPGHGNAGGTELLTHTIDLVEKQK